MILIRQEVLQNNILVNGRQKGAIMVVIVFVMMVFLTGLVLIQSEILFINQKEKLLGEYYERAIAAAVSCRETAMARLASNFQYRITVLTPIAEILPQMTRLPYKLNCALSAKRLDNSSPDMARINSLLANSLLSASSSSLTLATSTVLQLSTLKPTDVFAEIVSIGTVELPTIFSIRNISQTLRTVVGISYSSPVVLFTEMD